MSQSVNVELIGRGAHRQLQLTLPASSDVCPEATAAQPHRYQNMSVSFKLPPALMVDPYELDAALSSDVTLSLEGNLDLESPEVVSGWTDASLLMPLQATPSTLMVPIHNKYGIPSTDAEDTSGERLINIPELTAETHCSVARMDDSGAAVPGPAWVNVQSQHGLDWVLPVSNTSSILVVGGVTQLVQVLCAVCVLWICGQRWLESRMLKRELKHE